MQPLINRTGLRHKKDWIRGVFLVILWLLIYSLARDFWQVRTGFTRISEAEERLAEEEKMNRELEEKLSLVMTEEYKEKIIREQLNMQKIGEIVAVLPQNEYSSDTLSLEEEEGAENWERWWSLIR